MINKAITFVKIRHIRQKVRKTEMCNILIKLNFEIQT